MSDHIPFEIQSEIIKKLPVKSILQFRSVSKQWKSHIDNPKFIKNYPNPQKHHLLIWYEIDHVQTYTSIIDDKNTFPEQKFSLTAPALLNLLALTWTLGSVNGLICFYGMYIDLTYMVVLWNPSIRKCVGIHIPDEKYSPRGGTVIGFGVCSDTCDPKLVKIRKFKTNNICYWEVQVFTLSSRVWKIVYSGVPLTLGRLMSDHVFIDGVIYWRTVSCFIISFDLKSEKLGQVCLPDILVDTKDLLVTKVNESLGLLEYSKEGEKQVCGVWMRKDDMFTKIYTVKVEGKSVSPFNGSVLGFRNNGEVVLNMVDDDNNESTVEVYEPSSGHMNDVGIKGDYIKFFATSYMESLLLLDESNSIIH